MKAEPTIYVDMDGTLADYLEAVRREFPDDPEWDLWPPGQYDFPPGLQAKARKLWTSEQFWMCMESTAEIHMLHSALRGRSAHIVTYAPCNVARMAKVGWLFMRGFANYPLTFECEPGRLDIPARGEDGTPNILIDDCAGNLVSWARRGGIIIPVCRRWNHVTPNCKGCRWKDAICIGEHTTAETLDKNLHLAIAMAKGECRK